MNAHLRTSTPTKVVGWHCADQAMRRMRCGVIPWLVKGVAGWKVSTTSLLAFGSAGAHTASPARPGRVSCLPKLFLVRRENTMATKADFTPEEWSQVLGSVMMAGMAVTLADPSGLIGMTKEGLASGSALVAAKSDPNANALMKSVVADFET